MPGNSRAGVQALEGGEQLVDVGGIEASAVVAHVAGDAGVRGRGHPELDDGDVAAGGEFPGVAQEAGQDGAGEGGVGERPGGLLDREGDAAVRVLALEFCGYGGRLGAEVDPAGGLISVCAMRDRHARESRTSPMCWLAATIRPV